MKEKVSLLKVGRYDIEEIRLAILKSLDSWGGVASFIKPGQRVLLKPNLGFNSVPEKGAITHPAVVCAIARIVKEAGAIPLVGDSPIMPLLDKVIADCQIKHIFEEEMIEILPFEKSVKVEATPEDIFKSVYLSQEVLNADVVINIPKVKTHSLMIFTLGVKNLYGCIVGKRKSRWHTYVETDKQLFSILHLEILNAIKPVLTIADGIVSMEGEGPCTGGLVNTGFIAIGTDAVAVDTVIAEALGADTSRLFLTKASMKRKIGVCDIGSIDFPDCSIADLDIKPIVLPAIYDETISDSTKEKDLVMGKLHEMVWKLFHVNPVINQGKCVKCGCCEEVCPANAISMKKGKYKIDYSPCIRCFCCNEVCQYKALEVKRTFLSRFLP